MKSPSAFFLLFVALFSPTEAFFGGGGVRNAGAKSSPFVDEALAIYATNFPPKGETKKLFFADWGMPARDIDGSYVTSKKNVGKPNTGKSMFDFQEEKMTKAFNELARIYGDDEALAMTKILPNCLAFNSDNFSDSFDAFAEIFGYEEARGMVARNPGLLAVRPEQAAETDDQAMQLSYVIAVTRPLGGFGIASILGLLSVPALERATQFPIRATFLGALSGSTPGEAQTAIQAISDSTNLFGV
jgi:hypothetical protein